jgi:ABC-2 type transport system permease protein
MNSQSLQENVRIIWAVATKDIVEAVKNRMTISIIIGVAFLVLSGQALPLLLKLKNTPTAIAYDAGKSTLVAQWRKSRELELHTVASQQELERAVGESATPQLGLTIPANFDLLAESDTPIELDGYLAHWISPTDADATKTFFEEKLSELLGQSVRIDTQGHTVYPSADSGGQLFMMSMSLVAAILTICGAIVPFLMIEEKETHTLDALLVSPASIGQVVVGKALAGTFYGLVAAGVVFAFNPRLVVHWQVAILASVCGTLFAVAVGLLLGSLFDNPQSMNLWFGVVLLVLLMPVFLADMLASKTPAIVRTIMSWIPSVLMSQVVRTSYSANVPWGDVLLKLGIISGCAVAVLGLVAWRVRLSDR